MTHVTIDHDAIKQLSAEMQKSFDSNGPLRVAVEALIPDRLGAAAAAPEAIDDSDQRRCQRVRIVPPHGSGTFSE
jgi:hypothetical protein